MSRHSRMELLFLLWTGQSYRDRESGVRICRYFARAAARTSRRVAVSAARVSPFIGSGPQNLNVPRPFARSKRSFAAITITRPDQRLIRSADSWFRNGKARLLSRALQFLVMHPAGRFNASNDKDFQPPPTNGTGERESRTYDPRKRRSSN